MTTSAYSIFAIIITLAMGIGYVNTRFIKMQTTIAIMAGSLLISLLFIVAGKMGFHGYEPQISKLLATIDFRHLLLDGMLSFLLFAGALTVDINELKSQKWEIATLSSVSTILSTVFIGAATYYLLPLLDLNLPLIYCMLFGALISPTDPIAVLATFKEIGAPRKLNITVTGESLFNDGVGIVLFLTLYNLAFLDVPITAQNILYSFLRQTVGGIAYGALLGTFAYWLIKPIDDHKIEILITLAVVTGGYTLAQALDISGPLAMVVAGIFIGNRGRNFSMSKKSRESLDNFWELVDEILNAILFLLIGFELLIIKMGPHYLAAALMAVPLVLAVRFLVVSAPISLFKRKKRYPRHYTNILVWGGLRGGLAVALALALPNSHERNLILTMTYAVVMFAVIVQGLSVKHLVRMSKEQ